MQPRPYASWPSGPGPGSRLQRAFMLANFDLASRQSPSRATPNRCFAIWRVEGLDDLVVPDPVVRPASMRSIADGRVDRHGLAVEHEVPASRRERRCNFP
jgi:hypothetical protein